MSEPQSQSGLITSLRAAFFAGLLVGLVQAVPDFIIADNFARPPIGVLGYLGCFAATVMSYGLLWSVVLLVVGLVLHPMLRKRASEVRFERLFALGLGLALFLELYWWSRPYVYYGRPARSPERLAAAAGMLVVSLGAAALLAKLVARVPRGVLRGLGAFALVAWVGGFGFTQYERSLLADRGSINERNEDLPNVLLIVVDALRADVLSSYGSTVVATPNMDRIANEGVLFEQCIVQAPYTWTAFGSMLTGKYPRRHGLVAQEVGLRMMQNNVTLAHHLKTARRSDTGVELEGVDFVGGSFMTGALSHGSGLMRGFDAYTEMMMGHDLVELDSQWSVFRSNLLLWLVKSKLQQQLDSGLVVTMANDWIRDHADRRWTAMVHLYNTHTPYDPPAWARERFVDPKYSGPLSTFYSWHREAIERGDYVVNEADIAQVRALYNAEVLETDRLIGVLMGELESLGILDDTLVILTSDHGESLGEQHGQDKRARLLWEHNHMVQTNLWIPLVLRWPAKIPAGVRSDALVELVDLFPTVCDLLGLELPPDEGPRHRIDGKSLRPLWSENPPDAIKEFAYAENPGFISIQDVRWKLIVPRLTLTSEDPGAALSPMNYVRLFDLLEDPHELHNVLIEHMDQAERLVAALRAWNAEMPIPEHTMVMTARDFEQQNILNSLGYTSSGVGLEDIEK